MAPPSLCTPLSGSCSGPGDHKLCKGFPPRTRTAAGKPLEDSFCQEDKEREGLLSGSRSDGGGGGGEGVISVGGSYDEDDGLGASFGGGVGPGCGRSGQQVVVVDGGGLGLIKEQAAERVALLAASRSSRS